MDKFISVIKKSKKIAIITHTNPDGDAWGSSLMIYEFLDKNFPKIEKHIFTEYKTLSPEFQLMLKGVSVNPDKNEFDTAIVVDCGDENRFTQYHDIFSKAKNTICFDHHLNNTNFCKLNYNNIVPSNCENLYNYLTSTEYELTLKFFQFCYVGMLTDTNAFTTPSVSADTYKIASEIKAKGVDTNLIYKMFYQGFEKNKYMLLGRSITKAEFWFNNKVVFINLTEKDFKDCNVAEDDTTGIINQAFAMIKGAFACFLVTPRNATKHISMRSIEGIDVSKIACILGGGGHACASATDSALNLTELKTFLKKEIKKQIDSYTPKENKLF